MLAPDMAFCRRLSFNVLCLLMLYKVAVVKMRQPCSKTSPLVGTVHMEHGKEEYQSTVINASLVKGQTLCYDLMLEDQGKINSGKIFFISMIDAEQEYEVKFAYNFSVPTMEVKCICDCPGWTDYCNMNYESESCMRDYGHGTGACAKKYSTGYEAIGCLFWDPVEVCCDISVYKQYSTPDYTAVFLDNMATIYTFKVGIIDGSENVIEQLDKVKIFSSAVETNTRFGVIGIAGHPFEKAALSSTWYFMDYAGRELLTGEPINNLNERNVKKLGWYKTDAKGILLPIDLTGLRNSVTAKVENCKTDKISWHSSARFYHRKSSPLQAIGKRVKDVLNATVFFKTGGRRVIARIDNTLPVLLHTRINVSSNVIFRYKKSEMKKFEAKIHFDRFGYQNLTLFFTEAFGSFNGSTERNDSFLEYFTVTVPSAKPIDISKTLRLSSNYKCPNQVCLLAHGSYFIKCTTAPCREEALIGAKHEDNKLNPIHGISSHEENKSWIREHFQDSLSRPQDSVFDCFTEWGKVVIPIVTVLAGVVLFIVFCCVRTPGGLCFATCCCNFFTSEKSKQKMRSAKRKNNHDSLVNSLHTSSLTLQSTSSHVYDELDYGIVNTWLMGRLSQSRQQLLASMEQLPTEATSTSTEEMNSNGYLLPKQQKSTNRKKNHDSLVNSLYSLGLSLQSLSNHVYDELDYGMVNTWLLGHSAQPREQLLTSMEQLPAEATSTTMEEIDSDGYLSPKQQVLHLYTSITDLIIQEQQLLISMQNLSNLQQSREGCQSSKSDGDSVVTAITM